MAKRRFDITTLCHRRPFLTTVIIMNPLISVLCLALVTLQLATYSVASSESALEKPRQLQGEIFDMFFPDVDECRDTDGTIGPCDLTRFPSCASNERICYNRRPRQDKFYTDNRMPYFFIDYQSVFCYPVAWGGCSSCHPGRLCFSESRCVLDEQNYDCANWF